MYWKTGVGLAAAFALAAVAVGCETDEENAGAELGETAEVEATQDVELGTESAPATGGVVLQLDTLEGAGAYLTDQEGRALYLFTADQQGESTCYDACAEAWPPLLTQQGQPSAGAAPIQDGLLGTIQRRTGETQVTYNGHPLYYYVQDQGPGTATGQDVHGFGGEWYLVTPEGTELHGSGGESG